MFKHAGEHKDKHVRAHEVYSGVRNATAKAGAAAPVAAGKLKKLLDDGATVMSEAESINGVWTAMCEEHVDQSRFQRGKKRENAALQRVFTRVYPRIITKS